MRSPKARLLIVFLSLALVPLVHAQSNEPSDKNKPSDSKAATKEEVEQLRREVAELKGTLQRLLESHQLAAGVAAPGQQAPGGAQLVLASAVKPDEAAPPEDTDTDISPATIQAAKDAAQQKGSNVPLLAGWNGEHFFIKSQDGLFQIQPYGYVQTDYRAYKGDGAPSDTFLVRRARFGFQGNYGAHFQFALLTDASSTSGAIVRDVYINANILPALQLQFGQFKTPFAQEVVTGITNIDFVERGLQSLLYPSVATAFRSPGAVVHGDIHGGAFQYWAGVFNGKGIGAVNTTNEPEIIGRLRFYPWRNKKDSLLQGLAFGGTVDRGRTRGLSNELSFSGVLPDVAYNFFPSFRINGPTQRYNGEFTYLKGPWGVRGEYVQLLQEREGVGSEQLGGLGFITLPGIISKAWNIQATYLLTGEKRPENGTPRVKHPIGFGPETPGGGGGRGWGAWELAVRYTGIQAKETGANLLGFFTPGNVAQFDFKTDEITAGVNWYPNYWVRYQLNFDVNRLRDPSTIGAIPQNYIVILQRIQFRF